MIGSKVGTCGFWLPGRCAKVVRETNENKVNSYSVQLKVELGLQVGKEFDNISIKVMINSAL